MYWLLFVYWQEGKNLKKIPACLTIVSKRIGIKKNAFSCNIKSTVTACNNS
jgi:hypothetical protein